MKRELVAGLLTLSLLASMLPANAQAAEGMFGASAAGQVQTMTEGAGEDGVQTENAADIDGTQYATLAEAVAQAEEGATIRLLRDVELDASGVTGTAFAPGRGCTRAQLVTFLWRANGSPEPSEKENPFTDVSPDSYYYKAVLWAVEQGITSGVTKTAFAPDRVCTRAQAAVLLWRAEGSPAASGTHDFRDVAEGAYYTDAVAWAVESGVTQGTTSTTFEPGTTCTRAQIMTFLHRAMA